MCGLVHRMGWQLGLKRGSDNNDSAPYVRLEEDVEMTDASPVKSAGLFSDFGINPPVAAYHAAAGSESDNVDMLTSPDRNLSVDVDMSSSPLGDTTRDVVMGSPSPSRFSQPGCQTFWGAAGSRGENTVMMTPSSPLAMKVVVMQGPDCHEATYEAQGVPLAVKTNAKVAKNPFKNLVLGVKALRIAKPAIEEKQPALKSCLRKPRVATSLRLLKELRFRDDAFIGVCLETHEDMALVAQTPERVKEFISRSRAARTQQRELSQAAKGDGAHSADIPEEETAQDQLESDPSFPGLTIKDRDPLDRSLAHAALATRAREADAMASGAVDFALAMHRSGSWPHRNDAALVERHERERVASYQGPEREVTYVSGCGNGRVQLERFKDADTSMAVARGREREC